MHQAKRFGGDRIEPFRPAFRSVGTDRLQLESDLRRAIERKEFTLAYQPIVRLEDGSVAGFEALLRWEHPRRGSIPPSDFIPVAESCGLIVQLGLFAMQQAAEDLAAWQKQIGDVPLSVSVNLSSRQLIRRDLVSDVRSVIARANLKPRCFRLELTESLVMDNPEQTDHVLTKLKQLGIGLSLDDFGTGYSSLVLPDALSLRHDQDRQELRRRHHAEAGRAAQIDGQHGARARPVGGRRGHFGRKRRARTAADGLRIRAELHVRRRRSPRDAALKMLKEQYPLAQA